MEEPIRVQILLEAADLAALAAWQADNQVFSRSAAVRQMIRTLTANQQQSKETADGR